MYKLMNREKAGERLGDALAELAPIRPLVLAIAPGGVVIGRAVADRLDTDLDLVMVRGLVSARVPEVHVGTVDEDGHILTAPAAWNAGVDHRELHDEASYHRRAMQRMRRLMQRPPIDPAGRLVILCDDGISTGTIMLGAVAWARRHRALRVVAAVPVGSESGVVRVGSMVDSIVCNWTPEDFTQVQDYYIAFTSLTDGQIVNAICRRPVPRANEADSVRWHD